MNPVARSILAFAGLLLGSVCFANPVALPRYLIEAENVMVSITAKGAIVEGNYHFRWNDSFRGKLEGNGGPFALQLPVPISTNVVGSEAATIEADPTITINGRTYRPERETSVWKLEKLPEGVKVAVFDFWITDQDFGEKVAVIIKYHQPVLKTDGKDVVYYIPFLPLMNEARKSLNPRAYLINFQSADDTTLNLRTANEGVVQQTPNIISVRPQHKEIIGVERVPAPLEIKL